MLKTYKNQIFEAVQRSSFSIQHFTVQEDNSAVLVLRYNGDTSLYFRIEENPSNGHFFKHTYTRFDPPRYPKSESGYEAIHYVTAALRKWIEEEVVFSKREAEQPDRFAEFFGSVSPLSNETFSEQEKAQIRVSIQQFKVSIINEFGPNEAQLRLITEKLDHLSAGR